MPTIRVVEYLSLDGVFSDPMWTRPYFDEAVGEHQAESMRWADALLMGRVTYEGMSVAWPQAGNSPETGGDIMNSIGKFVPTSTLTEPTWNATFLTGDVVDAVRSLEGNLLVYGSGRLVETLRAADLVDQWRLIIAPVVLGEGRRLFTGATPSTFTVTRSVAAPSGMLLVDLERGASG